MKTPICWNFVMASFSRIYGVNRVMAEEKFHEIALQWCDDNDYKCEIFLDDLNKVDNYFRHQYESWEN